MVLEGDLWRVVVEANDCDLHFELAAPRRDRVDLAAPVRVRLTG